MHLTRQADYTMRLLIHLAVQPDQSATVEQIAQRYKISRHHLTKVAHRAVQAGYVSGVRGRSGGLKLARKPKDICIGEVLRTVEDWDIVECFAAELNACVITGGCGLKPILKQALDAWFAVLDRYSLADVVRRRTVLVQLLGWEVA